MAKELLCNKLKNDMQKHLLPEDVTVNTITIVCNLDINFYVANIAKYIDMSLGTIKKVSHGQIGRAHV